MPDPHNKNSHRTYESNTLHVPSLSISEGSKGGNNSREGQESANGQAQPSKISGETVQRIIDRLKGI